MVPDASGEGIVADRDQERGTLQGGAAIEQHLHPFEAWNRGPQAPVCGGRPTAGRPRRHVLAEPQTASRKVAEQTSVTAGINACQSASSAAGSAARNRRNSRYGRRPAPGALCSAELCAPPTSSAPIEWAMPMIARRGKALRAARRWRRAQSYSAQSSIARGSRAARRPRQPDAAIVVGQGRDAGVARKRAKRR